MAGPISIVLVDDHRILMDGLEALLSLNDRFRVSGKIDQVMDLPSQDLREADMLIMDINMKGRDGIEVLRSLRESGFSGKCLFLSSYDDLKLVNEAIQAGAQGYITKSSATDCLEEGIMVAMEGGLYYSPDIRERILRAFSKSGEDPAASEQSWLRLLTDREVEILKMIALQYTSEEIASQLHIAKSTVDTHRKNLISKLKVKNAVGLGLFAERHRLI